MLWGNASLLHTCVCFIFWIYEKIWRIFDASVTELFQQLNINSAIYEYHKHVLLRIMPSLGMWRRVDLVWTDVSEERIASIFMVVRLWLQSAATCSRWFLARSWQIQILLWLSSVPPEKCWDSVPISQATAISIQFLSNSSAILPLNAIFFIIIKKGKAIPATGHGGP
jgi:hypothetical protein